MMMTEITLVEMGIRRDKRRETRNVQEMMQEVKGINQMINKLQVLEEILMMLFL